MDTQRDGDVLSPSSSIAPLRRISPSRLIIAPNDIHCYPILWRHPVHRILVHFPLGEWLFRTLFPNRAHAMGDHPVHSKAGDYHSHFCIFLCLVSTSHLVALHPCFVTHHQKAADIPH